MSSSKLTGALRAAQQRTAIAPPTPSGGTYPLDQIQLRSQDTRSLNELHVADLAESIATLGLIEPLALDVKGRLLAGGHRLAAIQQIQANKPEAFQKQFPGGIVPARMFPFDAEQDPDLALQIEIAENEKRRDYSPNEIRAIANRLRTMGFEDVQGRPRKDQKPLMPALSVVVGKSIRRVRQLLNEDVASSDTHADGGEIDHSSSDPGKSGESRKRFLLLKTAVNALEQWETCHGGTEAEVALSNQLRYVLPLMREIIE
jgi:ParB family transcriptional regulator, chromosome partitioning protein